MTTLESIKLEPFKTDELYKIVEWNNGKSADFLLQWAGPNMHFPLTLDQLRNHYTLDLSIEKNKILLYKIVLVKTNSIVGCVELRQVDGNHNIGRVCRFLLGEEESRGKGYGLTVLQEILRIGFQEQSYQKITLGVFDFNQSAQKCYEKAGFLKEGLFLDVCKASNGFWNVYEMYITKEHWLQLSK